MLFRSLLLAFSLLAVSSAANAQSTQSGKPLIVGVDNSQPTAAPAADITVLENKLGIGTLMWGNVTNLAIDGVYAGEITGNTHVDPRGSNGFGNCVPAGLSYIVNENLGHVGSGVIKQTGWVHFAYDERCDGQ